jgi:hypothetical protein
VTAFIAHDISSWIGVPTALVIVGMVMLRKWGMGRRARRQQAREQQVTPGSSNERIPSQTQ